MNIIIVLLFFTYFATSYAEESRLKILNQLSEKILDPTKEEKWSELTTPLLQEFRLTTEKLLEKLKGYLVYLVEENNKILFFGFLAKEDEVVVPRISSTTVSRLTVRVQNPVSKQFYNYRFKFEKGHSESRVMTAKLNQTIPMEMWPASCFLSLDYIKVPVKAIVYGVGLDEDWNHVLMSFRVIETSDTVIRAKIIGYFKNMAKIHLGEPIFYKREFAGLLSSYYEKNMEHGIYEFDTVYTPPPYVP